MQFPLVGGKSRKMTRVQVTTWLCRRTTVVSSMGSSLNILLMIIIISDRVTQTPSTVKTILSKIEENLFLLFFSRVAKDDTNHLGEQKEPFSFLFPGIVYFSPQETFRDFITGLYLE